MATSGGDANSLLRGPRTPYWACNCGEHANFASRLKCRGCGKQAPQKIKSAALAADKQHDDGDWQPAKPSGRWACQNAACGYQRNFARNKVCYRCLAPRGVASLSPRSSAIVPAEFSRSNSSRSVSFQEDQTRLDKAKGLVAMLTSQYDEAAPVLAAAKAELAEAEAEERIKITLNASAVPTSSQLASAESKLKNLEKRHDDALATLGNAQQSVIDAQESVDDVVKAIELQKQEVLNIRSRLAGVDAHIVRFAKSVDALLVQFGSLQSAIDAGNTEVALKTISEQIEVVQGGLPVSLRNAVGNWASWAAPTVNAATSVAATSVSPAASELAARNERIRVAAAAIPPVGLNAQLPFGAMPISTAAQALLAQATAAAAQAPTLGSGGRPDDPGPFPEAGLEKLGGDDKMRTKDGTRVVNAEKSPSEEAEEVEEETEVVDADAPASKAQRTGDLPSSPSGAAGSGHCS